MGNRLLILLLALAPACGLAQTDPYTELNKRVQEELRARGFYEGPVNGIVGPETQAAIAQFQQSWPMPVHGMLDDDTLAALGIPPHPAERQTPEQPAEQKGG